MAASQVLMQMFQLSRLESNTLYNSDQYKNPVKEERGKKKPSLFAASWQLARTLLQHPEFPASEMPGTHLSPSGANLEKPNKAIMKNVHPMHDMHACKPGAHLPLYPDSAPVPHQQTATLTPLTHPPHVPLSVHAPEVLFCLLNVPLVMGLPCVPVLSAEHAKRKAREPFFQEVTDEWGLDLLQASGKASRTQG